MLYCCYVTFLTCIIVEGARRFGLLLMSLLKKCIHLIGHVFVISYFSFFFH